MKKIILVEDDIDLLETLGILLEDEGHNVLKFDKGKPVFSKLKKFLPDVMVIDLMLPDLNGEELAQYVKDDEELRDIKVILISADERVTKSAQKVGADGYLKKPFALDSLLSLV